MIKKHIVSFIIMLFIAQTFVAQVPPTARDDYDTADINTPLIVNAPGVLVNDTDPDIIPDAEPNPDSDVVIEVLTVSQFFVNGITFNAGETATFAQGTLTIAADGSYTFTPLIGYTGNVAVITYEITDGLFTNTANLLLTVEPVDDLLVIQGLGTCNQGFNANGEYVIRYNIELRNRSTARDFHESSLIKNINLINNLQNTFGNDCVVDVSRMFIRNNNFIFNYVENPYPKEFSIDAFNPEFATSNSNAIFNNDAIDNLTLYPRQSIFVDFCVTVKPFCNGRPNPTPSGSGINFNNIFSVTSDKGNASDAVLLTDFHTTEAVISAGLYVPEFNNFQERPPGTVNANGTYDYINTVIIANDGNATANNVNYNMGLGSFLDNGISFNELTITQISGPNVAINTNYNGDSDTFLLAPNNTLAAGETIVLEVFYLISPYSNTRYSNFNQTGLSQTQGVLDAFDDTTAANKRRFSFVIWSDNLGNHLDRYYIVNAPNANVSSSLYCNCSTAAMRFLFTASSSTNKIISDTKTSPNGILEHEEITFRITAKNTSEAIQLQNLQLQDNLSNICGGNIVSVSQPIIQNSTASTNPVLNPNFDGVSDINIFNGTSGILVANEEITVEFSVVFSENCISQNTAIFTTVDPLSGTVQSSNSVSLNASTDSDNDGISNFDDLDDDNDTILDVLEYDGLNPLGDDDADLIPNYRDTNFGADANADGIVDIFDFDNDGVPNHLDLDSDNDGILDIVEAGNAVLDTNNNGRTNSNVGSNGFDNTLENNDSVNAIHNFTIPNTDANGNPDFLDIDADGDGIVDNIEAQPTDNYITITGIVSETGIDTAYPNGISPIDSDNDTLFDYVDTNSDNDIRDDVIEGWDINSDGIPETIPANLDADNDGLDDAFDANDGIVNPSNNQTPESFPNVDNVDNPERDWREIIAIQILIGNITETEGGDFIFELLLRTKNNNAIPIESASPINIDFSIADGTETTTEYQIAIVPFDVANAAISTLIIPPLSTSATYTIPSFDDTIFELTEFFTLNGAITSNNTLNTEINAIGTILDNDVAPAISMNNSRGFEGENLVHTVTISHPCSTPIIININTTNQTAVSPIDFTRVSENITINGTIDENNANTSISFNIETLLDNLNELDEEFLQVSGLVTTGNVGTSDLQKTATIVDIDPNPFIEINDVKADEGNSLLFTIRLLNGASEPMLNYLPISFTLTTEDDTTIANQDYESVSELVNIPAFRSAITQSVNTINDKLNEDTEAFFLQANVNFLNVSNTFNPRGIGLIKDNDYPNLFSPNSDGISDFFEISGLEDYPNFKLIIFNRLGNEMYNYSNNGNENPLWWDGTYNGNPASTGVYYYTLDFNDGTTKPISNFIQLIR